MPDELEKKLDEALTLLRAMRPKVRRLAVQVGEAIKLLPTDDVVYLTMSEDSKRVRVFTKDGSEFFNFSSVSEVDALLADDPRFLKVHKSFLVNMEHVSEVRMASSGRELRFDVLPDVAIKVAQGNVREVEAYFGI